MRSAVARLGGTGSFCAPAQSRLAARLLVLISFIALTSSAAYADPIRVVATGNADAHEGNNTFFLSGEGFRLSGETAITGPLSACAPCAPGTLLSLSASAAPHIYGDPSIFDDTVYEGFTEYGGVFYSGLLSFVAGSVTVPDVPLNGHAELTAAFQFDGTLSGFDNFELSGAPLFSTGLIGGGTATVAFSNHAGVGLTASRITYEFEPAAATPEPASLLLLATGLAGVAARRRFVKRPAGPPAGP